MSAEKRLRELEELAALPILRADTPPHKPTYVDRRAYRGKRRRRERMEIAIGLLAIAVLCVLLTLMVQAGKPLDPLPERVVYAQAPEYPEGFENELIEQALLARATKIENCKISHYCACEKCCGKADGITATGFSVLEGVTVAVDPLVIPLGSDVYIEFADGTGNWYVATDTGVHGNAVDIYVEDHQEAWNLGVYRADVYAAPPEE